MGRYLWLNIAYLIFNTCVALSFFKYIRSEGLPINVAGAFYLLYLAAGGIILLHLVCICIMFFTKNMTFTIITTGISTVMTISIAVYSFKTLIEKGKTAALQKKWQEEADSPEGKRHAEFQNAIYANDSIKVKQLAEAGVQPTDNDLSDAITECFVNDIEISPDIFKTLLDHGADAHASPPAYIYNRFCKNFETVKLLLDGGAKPLPESDSYFPLVCLQQLKLLLQYGAGINTLSHVYYNSYKLEPKEVSSSPSQDGRWTPIMIYLMEYPKYFEETKFLLTQNPDLMYKDENGYTLQILLKHIIDDRTAKFEAIDDLLEFQKKIEADL